MSLEQESGEFEGTLSELSQFSGSDAQLTASVLAAMIAAGLKEITLDTVDLPKLETSKIKLVWGKTLSDSNFVTITIVEDVEV